MGGAAAGRGSSQSPCWWTPQVFVWLGTGQGKESHETLWAMVRCARRKKDGDSRGTRGPWVLIAAGGESGKLAGCPGVTLGRGEARGTQGDWESAGLGVEAP